MKKFDIVIGNPPFNGVKVGGGAGSGRPIWQKFVKLSFELAVENGIVSLIHPIQWRFNLDKRTYNDANKYLFHKQIKYISLATEPFNAGTIVDWYVAENTEKYCETEIDFIDGKDNMYINKNILPSYGNNILKSIIDSVLTVEDNGLFKRKAWGGLTILDDSYIGDKIEFKFAHGMKYTLGEYKIKEKPHIHQYSKKVIMSAVRQLRPVYDNGEIGIGDHVHYIIVNNSKEAKFLIDVINSKLMTIMQKTFASTIWDGKDSHWNNPYPISRLEISEDDVSTDEKLYGHFNLTVEEVKYIENNS